MRPWCYQFCTPRRGRNVHSPHRRTCPRGPPSPRQDPPPPEMANCRAGSRRRHRISPSRSEVVRKQCKVVIGKKEEREPPDSGVWFHTFFVWYHTIFVWYHTVRSCGSPDRILPGIRLELQR